MDRFVCVRLVQANRLDLTQFQFDYDLTFAIFFMHAEGTIYGRYGTRSDREEAERDMSAEGLTAAMRYALTLHEGYPKNKEHLAGKQPKLTAYKTPDDLPELKGKYEPRIDYERNTAKSCLHCHQITDAKRAVFRIAGKPIPDELIYIHPMPQVIGLTLDPTTRATVKKVEESSAADEAGFRKGDELMTLDGQPILSIADVQWVLHHTEDKAELPAEVRRDGSESVKLTVKLEEGWRQESDIAWRVSTWPLRRMGTGGLVLRELTEEERRKADLPEDKLGLMVHRVGQFGPHAAAKRAGFREGDIIVAFNGISKALSHSRFLVHTVQTTKPGQKVPIAILRNGRRMELTLPMQR